MFESIPLSLGTFLLCSAGIWIVANKLTNYLDIISERTGMGRALTGLLLLGISTSLPEIVTTLTAASSGQAQMAGSNLLGGVAMQVAILAFVEIFALRGKALTSMAPKSIILVQGVVLIFMISLYIAAFSTKELFSWHGVGIWPIAFFIFYLASIYLVYSYERNPRWAPSGEVNSASDASSDLKEKNILKYQNVATTQLSLRTAAAALGILVFGYLLTKSAESIVILGDLDGNFVGATLLALATSLPEITTSWSAIKLGAFTMAIANILGTNAVEVALFLPADIFYRKGPIINEMGNNSVFLATLGIILTATYMWGILERRNKTILGMGIDSALVLFFYITGMTIYYYI